MSFLRLVAQESHVSQGAAMTTKDGSQVVSTSSFLNPMPVRRGRTQARGAEFTVVRPLPSPRAEQQHCQ